MRHPDHPWRNIGFAIWIAAFTAVALFAMWKQQQFAHYLDGQCESRQVARAVTREALLDVPGRTPEMVARINRDLAPIECR